MKNRFEYFAIRLLTVLLLGILLLLLRAMTHNPISAVLTPQNISPWELSKLVFWPLLAAAAVTMPLSGGKKRLGGMLPWLVIAPAAAVLVFWALSAVSRSPGPYLLVWFVLSALAVFLAQRGVPAAGEDAVWLMLLAAMTLLYVVLTFLPAAIGPFLDPTDVAAMAVIPY